MLALDHVIIAVADLAGAARRFKADYGLDSIAGGRHEGHGTENRFVPLGEEYLELMAVADADEAAASPLGRWLMSQASPEGEPAAVCLRTDDIDAVAARLGEEPSPMTRRRPDGVVLRWRLAGLAGCVGPDSLPFFIQWDIAGADHPARAAAAHSVGPLGLSRIRIGGDPAAVAQRLGSEVRGLEVEPGEPGVREVVIPTPTGPISIR